ncbi:MAG TPA: TA system VapC family ribonuclease toxin [Acidobacteriaceae bacterium]
MTSLIFPDLNVWMALTLRSHDHHTIAWAWYKTLHRQEELAFCRMTQLGFLRLITTQSVAGDELVSQVGAWAAYDRWIEAGGATYLEEPLGIEIEFRFHADRKIPAPKEWGDSYLVAFAAAASLPLVTFDKGLSQRYARSILLAN